MYEVVLVIFLNMPKAKQQAFPICEENPLRFEEPGKFVFLPRLICDPGILDSEKSLKGAEALARNEHRHIRAKVIRATDW